MGPLNAANRLSPTAGVALRCDKAGLGPAWTGFHPMSLFSITPSEATASSTLPLGLGVWVTWAALALWMQGPRMLCCWVPRGGGVARVGFRLPMVWVSIFVAAPRVSAPAPPMMLFRTWALLVGVASPI